MDRYLEEIIIDKGYQHCFKWRKESNSDNWIGWFDKYVVLISLDDNVYYVQSSMSGLASSLDTLKEAKLHAESMLYPHSENQLYDSECYFESAHEAEYRIK